MLFSSVSFLIFFLPCLFVCYFLLPQRLRGARNLVLLVFSLAFYAFGGPKYLLLMLLSIAICYLAGLLIQFNKRLGLGFGVVLSLALLVWFKYAGFLSEIAAGIFPGLPVLEIVLPIGISFYTFQGLSYVIDVYRAEVEVQKNPLKLALYISLFPQLIAGPIVRYSTIADEIDNRSESRADFAEGCTRFMLGFAKKMLLANAGAEIADPIFAMDAATLPFTTAWIGIFAYAAQIYFDFSAYSDMAIGLGRIFGFHFLENFNYPYISRSVGEFWRRWHISLATWFRDYVYIPLGGSRRGRGRHVRNIVIVWLLTGLWHGAAWNYVLWGAYFLVILLAESFIWGKALERAPRFVSHFYTILLVFFSWVLFRCEGLVQTGHYFLAIFGLGGGGFFGRESVYYLVQFWPEWLCFIVAALPVKNWAKAALESRQDSKIARLTLELAPKALALLLFAMGYVKLVTGSFNPFIYFRF